MAVKVGNSVVSKAVMSICKAEEVRKETEMRMKPYANWEEFLMPAPLSIAILGELVFICAGQGDFTINKNQPKGGFKYIKYPESFRSCLMQVCNRGWHAFNEAHKNMDQIRLLSMSVPETMKMTVQTLFQDVEVVNALLPAQLKSIKSVADQCQNLASSVEEKFKDTILLIQELLEACMNAKQGYEEENKEIKVALEQAKLKESSAKKSQELAEKYIENTEKQLNNACAEFKEAMDSLPTGFDAVVIGVAECFINTASALASGIMTNISRQQFSDTREQNVIADLNVYSKSDLLMNYVTALNTFIGDNNTIIKEIYDPKTEKFNTQWIKKNFEELKNKIKQEKKCAPQKQAEEICKDGIKICSELETIAKSTNNEDKVIERVAESVKDLLSKARQFDSSSKSATNDTVFSPQLPGVAKSGFGSMASENARFKIEQNRQLLTTANERYQQGIENLKKQNEELTEILCTMRKCEIKEIDFESAKKMLIKGLDALGRVKEQWEKMIQFFQMISNLIQACLSRSLKDFVSSAESVQEIPNYSSVTFVKDLIYNQAFNASNIAHLVHMISETYTEVSGNYLMDRVSSLGRLITMEPDHPRFVHEREMFTAGCDEAQKAIYDIVIKKKEEFEANLERRVERISSGLNAVLPPASKKELKAIEESVQQGIRAMTPEEENQFA